MGRMKDIYMEVMHQYGEMPTDFSLTDYLLKKKRDENEWEETVKNAQERKSSQDDEILDGDGSSSKT